MILLLIALAVVFVIFAIGLTVLSLFGPIRRR